MAPAATMVLALHTRPACELGETVDKGFTTVDDVGSLQHRCADGPFHHRHPRRVHELDGQLPTRPNLQQPSDVDPLGSRRATEGGEAASTMKTISAEDAVAMIPDGANLMIGGFMG